MRERKTGYHGVGLLTTAAIGSIPPMAGAFVLPMSSEIFDSRNNPTTYSVAIAIRTPPVLLVACFV